MTKKELNRIAVFMKTGGHCHFCGDELSLTKYGKGRRKNHWGAWELDHVIQKARGGSPNLENCLPACTRCNQLRWSRTGENIRSRLLLGILANEQIEKGTQLGKVLLALKSGRLKLNAGRRKKRRR